VTEGIGIDGSDFAEGSEIFSEDGFRGRRDWTEEDGAGWYGREVRRRCDGVGWVGIGNADGDGERNVVCWVKLLSRGV
jgi:hypothetical protein